MGTRRVIVIDVTGLQVVDVETVDAVARAALVIRRSGADARVAGAGLELAGLLRLCGLADALGLEPGREPEHREEAGGVQEERDPADPAAIGLEDLE